MSYKEQNEVLQRIREIEKTLNYNLTSSTNSINGKVGELELKYETIKSKVESLDSFYNEYKIKADKIDEFLSFKNKSSDQITSHEIKINSLQNEFGVIRTKYDKMISDNLTVPGFIGEFCKYKNIREYIDNNIKEMNSLINFKNQGSLELKNNNNKIETLIKQFTGTLDKFSDRQNIILNNFRNEIYNKINEEINNLDIKFEKVKIHNTKEAKNLIVKTDELIIVTKETMNFKDKLQEYFDEKLENIKFNFNVIKENINDFYEDYNNIRDKFKVIEDFVKEFNMKKYNKKDDYQIGRNLSKRDNQKHKTFILRSNKVIDLNNKTENLNEEKKNKSSIKLVKVNKEENKKKIESKSTEKEIIQKEEKNIKIKKEDNKIERNKSDKEIEKEKNIEKENKKKEGKVFEYNKEKKISENNNNKENNDIKLNLQENIKLENNNSKEENLLEEKLEKEEKKITKESEKKVLETLNKNSPKILKKKQKSDYEIQITERFFTEPDYHSSEEENNSPILMPKYFNQTTYFKKDLLNSEAQKNKKIKQKSEFISHNFFGQINNNNSPDKIYFKTIDNYEKEKYDTDRDLNKHLEDFILKKNIINLRLNGKGDKTFGTTIVKDFNLNNKFLNTNSYFYQNNENNQNKKKKESIDCKKKEKKRKKIINVSEIFYNKAEILNRKVEEICELFNKKKY